MSNSTRDEISPDWPSELHEPIAKLGQPEGTYRASPSRVARKSVTGVLLILAGIVGIVVCIGLLMNSPDAHWGILLAHLIALPVAGYRLMRAAWLSQGLWLFIYAAGLLRWQKGILSTHLWDEISHVTFIRLHEVGETPVRRPDGNLAAPRIPLNPENVRKWGTHMVVTRWDGTEVELSGLLENSHRLFEVVQERTARTRWPALRSIFEAGGRVDFGELSVDHDGIWREKRHLRWSEFRGLRIKNSRMIILTGRKSRQWLDVPIHRITNPHLFWKMALSAPVLLANTKSQV